MIADIIDFAQAANELQRTQDLERTSSQELLAAKARILYLITDGQRNDTDVLVKDSDRLHFEVIRSAAKINQKENSVEVLRLASAYIDQRTLKRRYKERELTIIYDFLDSIRHSHSYVSTA